MLGNRREDMRTRVPATLLISSRNRPVMLLDTVRSVLDGDEVPDEIVVVDQSDVENPVLATFRSAEVPSFRYLWSPSAGASRGRNAAIREARNDLLVLTDDDMLAPSGWLGALVSALAEAGPRSVVTGSVLPLGLGGHVASIREDGERTVYTGRIDADVLYTGNMAMLRSAVDDVGLFDERLGPGTRFPAAEDNDFGLRLLAAGYRIVYEPRAAIYHRAWRRRSEYLRLQWDYGVGRGAYYAKYAMERDAHMAARMMRDLGVTLGYCAGRLLREPLLSAGGAATVLGILSGAVAWAIAAPPATEAHVE
jgi:GT2 family glycosyltransferase